jgi:RHS repeat-associated protein
VISSGDGKAKMWDADYYPYGTLRLVVNNLTNYQFTGYEHDYGAGHNNANFRYQSTTLGRFMSPDPGEGNTTNLQTWNRYAYVANRVLTATDPLGFFLYVEGADGGGGGSDDFCFDCALLPGSIIIYPTAGGGGGGGSRNPSSRPTPKPRGPGARPSRVPPDTTIPSGTTI